MHLNVDFTSLYAAVNRMGADAVEPGFVIRKKMVRLDPIDIELEAGIEVDSSEVDSTDNGLLTYKGRQVLLYIQDHRSKIQDVLNNRKDGNKFHVVYCRTLREMHSDGRYERYVVTNDLSGEFYITGYDYDTRSPIDGKARLKVCKNCLDKLDYWLPRRTRDQTVAEFDLEVFFAKYKSSFPHIPRRRAGVFDDPVQAHLAARTTKERTK